MILADLADADRYSQLHPDFAAAFAFLRRADFARLADGRHELAGDRLYAMVSRYRTRPAPGEMRWESHRDYIDIQYLAEGSESIGWSPLAELRAGEPYSAAKDVAFHAGAGEVITLRAGRFAVFFPEDAHAPGLAAGAPAGVVKVVVKVRCRGQR